MWSSIDLFDKSQIVNQFNIIKISLASPKKILSWSHGEVKNAETINYRTFKPEINGLFCPRIFGPLKNCECLCGKYQNIKYIGVICERCGIEVTSPQVRRERMGHIILAAPVSHIWFLKSLPSKLGIILDINLKKLEQVLYFKSYIVINPGITSFKYKQIISENDYKCALKEYGKNSFIATMGAEGILKLLRLIDIDNDIKNIKLKIKSFKSDLKIKKYIKHLKILENFKLYNIKPEWMILKILPVLPPDLRPLVPLEGGRFAVSDLNDLYRRIINRNNRLKKLINLKAPEIITKNEKRMLQESVDSLLDNGRHGLAAMGVNKRPLKSLSEIIKGKTGRFRQNLLGKRVDYSGRTVIVSGPQLSLHQCGLPKLMALELFKPFLLNRLKKIGLAATTKLAKKIIKKPNLIVWKILKDIVKDHPILLNRAPTLHRLGIQAFEAILINGKAIQLHPLVCTAFNADFDGDQMAVHVPLSIEAQLEAKLLMMSSNNILFPSNGEPSITPSQDMILGIYYVTQDSIIENKNDGMFFCNVYEVISAYNNKIISLFTHINVRIYENLNINFLYNSKKNNFNKYFKMYKTTVGRILLFQILPKNLPFSLINKVLDKKEVSKLISISFKKNGLHKTVIFVDKLMQFGFKFSTIAGISVCINDMIIPKEKKGIILSAKNNVKQIYNQYFSGLISNNERYNKIIDIWSKTNSKVSNAMMCQLNKNNIKNKKYIKELFNSIYIMADSGARGSLAQICQLSGMRGLMSKPDGSIIETPILANFREGLDVLQYFISTHGARKGLADTALKTANSGYLTRRLVDVAQDLVIIEYDCNTNNGFYLEKIVENGKIIESLGNRVLGRVLADNLIFPNFSNILYKAGTLINEKISREIDIFCIDKVKVRTPLTCNTYYGLCAKCYGKDLSKNLLVNVGESVGIIAAQSIGEPGTQLTMRTFHVGGAVSGIMSTENNIDAKFDGKIYFSPKMRFVSNINNEFIVTSFNSEITIVGSNNKKEIYKIPYGAVLLVKNKTLVKSGEKLAYWDLSTKNIITEYAGIVKFENIKEGLNIIKKIDKISGSCNFIVIDNKKNISSIYNNINLPKIKIFNDFDKKNKKILNKKKFFVFKLQTGYTIVVKDGQIVKPGEILAYTSTISQKVRDITGGLPKVVELFEARSLKYPAILSKIKGIIFFGKETKKKKYINVINKNNLGYEISISKNRLILVYEGQKVYKGDVLVEGPLNPKDILKLFGIFKLSQYIINEVQNVYRLQGVKINEKHIEIIIKQMLRKVKIIESGDTKYIIGEQVEKYELLKKNNLMILQNKNPAKYINILLGITKSSLSTNSFVSAASFQETTKVLTEAAILCKKDKLRGLKENVIIGRLIPAGTGLMFHKFKKNIDL